MAVEMKTEGGPALWGSWPTSLMLVCDVASSKQFDFVKENRWLRLNQKLSL